MPCEYEMVKNGTGTGSDGVGRVGPMGFMFLGLQVDCEGVHFLL
jgi:hypothetical protein